MAQVPTQRIGAYLRKMAIDGYIIYTDTADIKLFTAELSAIGKNINQIAKRINAGKASYKSDIHSSLQDAVILSHGEKRTNIYEVSIMSSVVKFFL